MKNLKRKYFELWADEEAQNYILKWLLIGAFTVIVIESACLCALSLRKPTLIAVGQTETKVLTLEKPQQELLYDELKRCVESYVKMHYNWDFNTIDAAHQNAAKYISDRFKKVFLTTNLDQVKEVKERKVSQNVYFAKPTEIDTQKLTAKVILERVFSIGTIKAALPLELDLEFEYGPRTIENPEGIYIVSEKQKL